MQNGKIYGLKINQLLDTEDYSRIVLEVFWDQPLGQISRVPE